MPNSGLAQFSYGTLTAAIALYAVAMLAFACDFAFGRRRAVAVVSPSAATAGPEQAGQAGVPVLAGAKAGAASAAGAAGPAGAGAGAGAGQAEDLAGHSFPADPSDASELADLSARQGGPPAAAAERSRWPERGWLRAAFLITCAGLVLHIISITARGIDENRVPWGNMYEFVAAITCAAVLVLVVASVRFRAYFMGLFVLLPVVVALAVDVVVIYTPVGRLVPALQSYWIAIHVTAMIVAIGMYIFGAVTTVLYLLVARHERKVAAGEGSGGVLAQLPGSEVLDRLAYRAILFAFPAWTFAVIAGAIWADHAWGRYWGWDPKETWSFITWVVYAAFLHARATAGWRGRRAAYIQLVGFACLLFNLVGINLWITGLHSYAGMG